MKRYIRANSFTMDHDNKMKVMEWLDRASRKLDKFCKAHSNEKYYYEIDDVSWGTDCFNIPVFKGKVTDPRDYRQIDNFRFCYDPDDVFERDAEEQLEDKLDEFLDSLSYHL